MRYDSPASNKSLRLFVDAVIRVMAQTLTDIDACSLDVDLLHYFIH